ncbi:anti-sigma factor family protein [Nocardiopsis alba]|uniref:anti-sigma factor family protein n=1 Tax=Nocardiopsis alba TaxID=53437 RepID=UPI0035E2A72D
MTSHPDVEALAFFAEDLLDPDEERSVADHIETCATCATTLDDLAGVSRTLAETPAPALPRDVADLLDDGIARAVAERAANEATDGTEHEVPSVEENRPAKVVPFTPKRRGLGLPRLMMVAAASVFVIGGGTAVLTNVLSEDRADQGVASSPLVEESESDPDITRSYSTEALESGTVYTEERLAEQASRVLAMTEEGESGTGPGVQTLSSDLPAGAQECVTLYEEATGSRVTLLDDALWEGGSESGERAWVMFVRDADGASVVVLDPTCARGGDVTEQVLAEERL